MTLSWQRAVSVSVHLKHGQKVPSTLILDCNCFWTVKWHYSWLRSAQVATPDQRASHSGQWCSAKTSSTAQIQWTWLNTIQRLDTAFETSRGQFDDREYGTKAIYKMNSGFISTKAEVWKDKPRWFMVSYILYMNKSSDVRHFRNIRDWFCHFCSLIVKDLGVGGPTPDQRNSVMGTGTWDTLWLGRNSM